DAEVAPSDPQNLETPESTLQTEPQEAASGEESSEDLRVKRLIDATLSSMRTDKPEIQDQATTPKSALTRLDKVKEFSNTINRIEVEPTLTEKSKTSLTRLERLKAQNETGSGTILPKEVSPSKSSLTKLDKFKEFAERKKEEQAKLSNDSSKSSLTRLEKIKELSKKVDGQDSAARSGDKTSAPAKPAKEPASPGGKIVLNLGAASKQKDKKDKPAPAVQPEEPAVAANPAVMRDQLKTKHRKHLDKLKPYVDSTKNWVKSHKKLVAASAAGLVLLGIATQIVRMNMSEAKFQEGKVLYDQKKYEEALKSFQSAISLDSGRADVLGYLGGTYNHLHDMGKAEDELNKALAIKPDDTDLLTRRGYVLLQLQKYPEAIKDYEKLFALKLDGKTMYDYENLAICYEMTGNYASSIQNFGAALNIKSDEVSAFIGRGDCYLKLKQFDRAIKDYNRALKINPDAIAAYLGRGSAYQGTKNYTMALADFDTAVRKFPQDAFAYMTRGDLYSETQKYNQAMSDYNRAIELAPRLADAFEKRGRLNIKIGDIIAALNDFNKVTAVGGKETALLLSERADAAASLGKYDQAINDASKAIALAPNNPKPLQIRAYSYGCVGKFQNAVADCNTALKINPRLASILVLRACQNVALGNNMSAVSDFESALKIDPKNVDAHRERGNLYLNDGNYASASNEFEPVLKVDPKDQSVRKKLAIAQGALRKGAQNAAIVGTTTQSDKDAAKIRARLLASDFPTLVKDGYEAMQTGNLGYSLAALTRAVQMKPNDTTARQYLASAMLAAGQPMNAEAQYKSLATMGVKVPDAEQKLAEAFASTGNYSRAVAYYRMLLQQSPSDHRYILGLADACLNAGRTEE
ncbi:MAG TPA: tetratricopeptide repeat protein, partial [Chroococcales cyanobacterium]